MADLVSFGNADRDIEQALIALKKGKPKFYPFRISADKKSLVWISSSSEKNLKLFSVSRIIPGQRTAVFQRYLRPDKDYLSFSLLYNSGKRSLDLICKDNVEAEIWISGLKSLISSGQAGRSKIDGWNEGGLYFDENRDLASNNPSNGSATARKVSSSEVSTSSNLSNSPNSYCLDSSIYTERSHVTLDQSNMQVKGSGSDAFRVTVSSAPSTSSQGSAPDDCDALGDVYIWGEVICDNIIRVGPEKNASSISTRNDVLLPKPLESNVVLDVHYIACGVRHAALVTRQGEVFSWGEESGGWPCHGFRKDITQPLLVESLSSCSVDLVACGEFHTCAITMAGELYTWGDCTHRSGLLGHGTDVSNWIPKRILGPLEGLQIAQVTCGPWHTALVTVTGQLYTFGDGTFGVLGHGNRESVSYPREVESVSGLRTITVACGVWHTAAVVEVIVTQSSAIVSSGKLFTWGDGDKHRLGHGDKESRLKPTCVSALIDYNFQKLACGHSLTVGLTTSGLVFTMGSPVYGQLGNPQSDGKLPCLVEDKLTGEYAEEISCGAYHVTVLTSKNEVYTWGKGANGRLGHGDVEDRKTPIQVEALKDKHVRYIACGSNYTAAICLHIWVSGAEQSQCSACRQTFGFTRKRHNCYNCGLVHCHGCSAKKSLHAVLAPNPSKPYRVCDSCYIKLSNMAEAVVNRKNAKPRLSGENKDKLDKSDLKLVKSAMSNLDLIKIDSKATKHRKKADIFSLGHSYTAPSVLLLRDAVMSTSVDTRRSVPKPIFIPSTVSSRSVSPFSRKSIPPRSATPVPTTSGLSSTKNIDDSIKKTNEILNHELHKFRLQVESLTNRCELQELELQKSVKKVQEAMTLAAEETAKCTAAKEVIKSLTAQLKDMAEKLPAGSYDPESFKLTHLPNGLEPNGALYPVTNVETNSTTESNEAFSFKFDSAPSNGKQELIESLTHHAHSAFSVGISTSNGTNNCPGVKLPNGGGGSQFQGGGGAQSQGTESARPRPHQDSDNSKSGTTPSTASEVETEWMVQYEPGVYITLVAFRDGTRDLKRVRFSRRRFGEHQAETWWSENREKVYERYNVRGIDKSSASGQPAEISDKAFSPSSQR